jgi:hypothetical protein
MKYIVHFLGVVHLCGSNLSLADTSVAGGVHLPFTYNAMRGLLLPSGFCSAACSGYSISVLSLGNISVLQNTTEIRASGGGAIVVPQTCILSALTSSTISLLETTKLQSFLYSL